MLSPSPASFIPTDDASSGLDGPLDFSSEPSTPQPHLLRILIVDDNAVNLAVLGKLLRKSFAHLLDGPPVAVDSALKALQLLQENVYDLILMDIQMPFLSGVDCTRRIRHGSDRVLEANRQATIVAVTTAVGSEPELLYRRAGFDGLIGKPVKAEVMKELLEPLLAAAQEAAPKVTPIVNKGQIMLPPLPVVPAKGQRCFFLASSSNVDDASSSNAPSITKTKNFEALLKEQTRISLFRYGACAIARTNSAIGVSDRRRIRDYDFESTPPLSSSSSGEEDKHSDRLRDMAGDVATINGPNEDSSLVRVASTDSNSKWSRPRRGASLTISQSSLNEQIQRELQAARLQVPAHRTRYPPHTTRRSVPAIITQRHGVEQEIESSGLDAYSHVDATAVDEDLAADEPLSPFSHFGNSGRSDPVYQLIGDRQQQQYSRRSSSPQPKVHPSLVPVSYSTQWSSRSSYGSNSRRSSSMGYSSSSADSGSPMSGQSSRSKSVTTDGEYEDEGITPLTTPDREHTHFPLAPIEESKAIVTLADVPPCPLSSSPSADTTNVVDPRKYGTNDASGTAPTPRMRSSPWRPPLERQTATREVFTIAKVLHEQFRDFKI